LHSDILGLIERGAFLANVTMPSSLIGPGKWYRFEFAVSRRDGCRRQFGHTSNPKR